MEIKNIKEVFMKYSKNYEKSGRLNLKINHTLRVALNAKMIGESLMLSEEEITLCYLIGICHDIGRFEQIRLFNTFSDNDSGIDHASYSNHILFDDGLINEFLCDEKYYSIIKKAVYNHNKIKLEDNLSEKEKLFCNIIRDADKLDILNVLTIEDKKNIYWNDNFDINSINNKLIEQLKNYQLIDYKDIKNNADLIIAFYDYVYDFNFEKSYEIIKENDYYNKYLENIKNDFKEYVYIQAKEINNFINKYIDNKIKKYK